jgi:ABC-type lipoprotein export system ATPase subunit
MANDNFIGLRGSEWRKWDLQVHTPASHLNNQFEGGWDKYVQTLFRTLIAKDVAVVGLTDYFTIDGYKVVREYLADDAKLAKLFEAEEIAKVKAIRVLPNIEFRLNKLVGPNRVNAHVIVSDEVPIKDIEENFLHDLTFTYEAEPHATAEKNKLKVENLKRLGERLIKDHAKFADKSAIYVGMMNAVVDDDEILKQLCGDSRFKDKFLFCIVADEDLPKVKWDGQDHHTRKLLIQRSSALFSGSPATRNWALAQPPQYTDGEEHFLREFKTLKACLHGSDCHDFPRIAHPCARRGDKSHDCQKKPEDCDLRYCWIKADTTFEGLRQIIHEPADRAFIGPSAPDYHDQARVISSITIEDGAGWFADAEIPLNPGMVSIIGQKGSGKSALADLIAFAAGSWQDDESSFLRRARGHLDGMKITLNWADGEDCGGTIGKGGNANDEVRYLSQNYVERICAKDGITRELVSEIENVIFNYLDPTDTLNASDFDQLRAIKTEGVRAEGERLRAEIHSVIRDECTLRDLLAKQPEKTARVKSLKQERDGLAKQMPPAATPEEKKILEDLQAKREALTKAQQQAANEKQHLQSLTDLKARFAGFKGQMERFYREIEPSLVALGVPDAERPNFQPQFKGDIDAPLQKRADAINLKLAKIDGGEPLADGTIKKLQAEIEALMKRETADKARQERTKQIQTRIAAINAEVDRLEAETKNVEEVERPKLRTMTDKRLEAYVAYFANLGIEQKSLQALYEPIRDQLTAQALLKGKELEFAIRWSANIGKWLERGSVLFDQRRSIPYGTFDQLNQAARNVLLPAWASGDPEAIGKAFDAFMQEFRNPANGPWQNYVRANVTLEDVLTWLYEVDHITLEYGLKFNGADLESLSPGTKGIVLLILFLGMDTNDTRPLIVDQPDENLDNESIYNLLTPYFRAAKMRRQVIVITHNPNLVVNSDSEQIIVATAEKQDNGLPVITYATGALEDNAPTGMRRQVCNILEGGDVAFLKRERRYAINAAT